MAGMGLRRVKELLEEACIHLHLTSVIQIRFTKGRGAFAKNLNKPKDTWMPKPRCMSGFNIISSTCLPSPAAPYEELKWAGKGDSSKERKKSICSVWEMDF